MLARTSPIPPLVAASCYHSPRRFHSFHYCLWFSCQFWPLLGRGVPWRYMLGLDNAPRPTQLEPSAQSASRTKVATLTKTQSPSRSDRRHWHSFRLEYPYNKLFPVYLGLLRLRRSLQPTEGVSNTRPNNGASMYWKERERLTGEDTCGCGGRRLWGGKKVL